MTRKSVVIAATVAAGFWRCGRHFPHAGVIVQQDEFDETQWHILDAEPMLRIRPAAREDVATLFKAAGGKVEALGELKDFTPPVIIEDIGTLDADDDHIVEPNVEQASEADQATSQEADTLDARAAKIVEAIGGLRAEDFQANGKPKVDSLNDLLAGDLDKKVSAAERDAAWDVFQANQPKTEPQD